VKTRVYITVDVECAEERMVGGKLQPAMGYDVRVWGRLANQREELGVDLIMRELEAAGLRGTFFVEPIGSLSFGEAGLSSVVGELHRRGHDVQLHLHPIQRDARWITEGLDPRPDDIGAYSLIEQAHLLREGKQILARCGVPADSIRAFRAGNFGASNVTWEAMEVAGLTLSSNYNPCYFDRGCAMRSLRAGPGLFRSDVPAVWELPISCLIEPSGGYRHLQITAVSLEEMEHCLLRSRELGIREVTIVTHSFELFFMDSPAERRGHKNLINLHRLRGLCRFLQERSDAFEVDTCGALAARLASERADRPPGAVDFPRSRPAIHYRRVAEQAVKRLAARVPFAP
jgi:hypothetical protein